MNTVHLSGVKKKYDRKTIFTDLNIELSGNRFVIILGENGIGKTTFLKMCAGLAPYQSGCLAINGEERRYGLTKETTYTSEESRFDPYLTVNDVLDIHTKQFNGFHRESAEEMVDRVQLPRRTNTRALSRGQRHLLSMVVATAKPHSVILADEMLANLDTTKKDALRSILTDFVMDEGRMILIATHAYEDVEMLADGAIVLQQDQAVVIPDLEEWRMQHSSSLKDLFAEVGRR